MVVHIIPAPNHIINLKEKDCSCLLSTTYVKTLNLKQEWREERVKVFSQWLQDSRHLLNVILIN